MTDVKLIALSHWHRDHSGGLLSAIKLANRSRPNGNNVVVDVHPNRPAYRGVMLQEPISLQADPTFEEIEAAGGKVEATSGQHTVLDDTFLISGEIPRLTEYEQGIPGGIRLDNPKGGWESDELITEERYVMCKIKGERVTSS